MLRIRMIAMVCQAAWLLATPALADDRTRCLDSGDALPEERLAACTRAMEAEDAGGRRLAVLLNSRGWTFRHKGDYERAVADFDEAIRLDPAYVAPHLGRGIGHLRLREYDAALADFTKAIALDRWLALAYVGRGETLLEMSDAATDRAIADFNRAIKINPALPQAYVDRGFAFQRQGALDKAIADYDRAIALDPSLAAAYANRGAAREEKGEHAAARADYEAALALPQKGPGRERAQDAARARLAGLPELR
jgi:tetratricopeptide (TPR) repeat protein